MMKKTFFYLSMAVAMTFSSCGGRTEESNAVVDSLAAAEKPDSLVQPDEEAGTAVKKDETREEVAKINTSLLGKWEALDEGMEVEIAMELSDKFSGSDKTYGKLVVYCVFEIDYTLKFKSIAPDGDNIKVHYEKIAEIYEGAIGDEDYDVRSEKVGEGDLTIVALGNNKVKLDCRDSRLKNKVLYRGR